MKPAVWVVGSTNVDLSVRTDRLPEPGETVIGGTFLRANGGKGANQAVAAARAGAAVTFLTAVGNDVFGSECLKAFAEEGIDTSRVITVDDESTGVALITVDKTGENCIVVAPGANDALTAPAVERAVAALPQSGAVVCQLETPLDGVEAALDLARKRGLITILDPAPARPIPNAILATVDCLTPNESETETLTGIRPENEEAALQAAHKLRSAGVATVILTLGEKGALLVDHEGHLQLPPPTVKAVDTTAAGDAFSGYLAAHVAGGATFRSALPYAICAGSLTTRSMGAQPAIPTSDDVEEAKSIWNDGLT